MNVKKQLTLSVTIWLAMLILPRSAPAENPKDYPAAPEWQISEWINSDPISLTDLKGKVVIVEFFQLWCPGCNRFSVPVMMEWERKYRDNENVQLVSIHTVFEGHSYQTPEKLRSYVKEKGIRHPVGVDAHTAGQHTPITMRRYRTRGTPEMAIIDKQGRIRFRHFGGFNDRAVEGLIEELVEEQP